MAGAKPTGHVRVIERKGGPVFYAKLKLRCYEIFESFDDAVRHTDIALALADEGGLSG